MGRDIYIYIYGQGYIYIHVYIYIYIYGQGIVKKKRKTNQQNLIKYQNYFAFYKSDQGTVRSAKSQFDWRVVNESSEGRQHNAQRGFSGTDLV